MGIADGIHTNIFTTSTSRSIRNELMKLPLFEGLSAREVALLCKLIYTRHFKTNEYIFYKGDPGSAMYVILKGDVEIMDHKNGKMFRIAFLNDHSFFGEIALLDDAPRTASARATCESTILCLFKDDLKNFSKKHPVTGLKIMNNLSIVLAKRLRYTNERLVEVQTKNGKRK